MIKGCLKVLLLLMISLMLISCAVQKTQMIQPIFKPYIIRASEYEQKVDNFMVILDASGTMSETYKGRTKFQIAAEVVDRMNQTIPDLKLTAGLRTLGQGFSDTTELRYGLTDIRGQVLKMPLIPLQRVA